MARKSSTSNTGFLNPSTEADNPNGLPAEVAEVYSKTERLLAEGQIEKALEVLSRAKANSPWIMNALGVCQLRLGNSKKAVDVFRGLTLAPGGLMLRTDVPVVFKSNYAIALLSAENLGGCLSILTEIEKENHPTIGKLKAAIQQWKQSLTFWERISSYMGSHPERPVELNFPLGDLE